MMKTLFRSILALIIGLTSMSIYAQTNPTPFNLQGNSGNYSFTQWNATSTAGTYPASMRFYRVSGEQTSPQTPTGDWDCAYNLTQRPRYVGKNDTGICMLNTGSPMWDNCASGATTQNKYPGVILLSLNTTGRQSIVFNYNAICFAQGDGNVITSPWNFPNRRVFRLEPQYRIGNSGVWTTISGAARDNWNNFNAPLAFNNPDTSAVNFTLPAACDNQSEVQVRWCFYQIVNPNSGVNGAGQRPQLGLDELQVTSSVFNVNFPTKLEVVSVNNGNPPTANVPFDVVVRTIDNSNLPQNVTANTTVSLTINNGSGTLGGTTSAQINTGSNTITISGVTYNPAENGVSLTASVTAGPALTPANSSSFNVLAQATSLSINALTTTVFLGSPLAGATVVNALRPDLTIDNTYNGICNVTVASGPGTISGTTSVNFVNGVATFNSNTISFSAVGNYTLTFASGVLSSATSGTIEVLNPGFFATVMPQYVPRGNSGDRVPVAYFLTINGLQPNKTYRYINQLDSVGGPVTTGAGNVIYMNNAGTFNRTTTTSMNTAGQYGTFTTNGLGSFSGWFLSELTTNARFNDGKQVIVRLRLNDGNNGTAVATTLSTTQPMTVRTLGTGSNNLSLVYSNYRNEKKFVAYYDNAAGTGQPLACVPVEVTGIAWNGITEINSSFKNNVSGKAGRYMGWVNNTNGIYAIREFDLAANTTTFMTDADGIWDCASGPVSTINTNNGGNALNMMFGVDSVSLDSTDCGKLDFSLVPLNVGNAKGVVTAANNAIIYETQFFSNPTLTTQIGGTYTSKARNIVWTNIPGLQWNNTYYTRSRALVGNVYGPWGKVCQIGFRQNPAISGIPTTNLEARFCNSTRTVKAGQSLVALPISGATAYEFQFYSDSLLTNLYASAFSRGISFQVNSLVPSLAQGATYWVRVRAFIGFTFGNWGSVCKLQTEQAPPRLGNSNFAINVYPNPFKGTTQITSDQSTTIAVLDMSGKVIETIRLNGSGTVTIGETYANGVYLINAVNTNGEVSRFKLVKTN